MRLFGGPRTPGVLFVQATILLDLMGIGLILPVLPTLIGTLTDGRDAQTYWFSTLVFVYGAMQFACAPLLGALSDRYGRRPILLIGIAGLGLMFLVPAIVDSLWLILLSRAIGGATAANLAVANAYVADVTPPALRAQAFGKLGAVFGIGFIIGPALGGMLGTIDLHLPFFVAAALSLTNFAYGWFVLPESLPRERRSHLLPHKANPFRSLIGLAQLKGVGALVVVAALVNLAMFMLHATWVLFTEFRHGWNPSQVGWSLFVVGVVSLLVQGVWLGRLLQRFGERRLILFGIASGMVAYFLYASLPFGWMLYLIISANFLAYAVQPALNATVSRAARPEEQGHAMGALGALASLMLVIAPFIGGPLLAAASHGPPSWRLGAPYFLSSALMALALGLALWHFARHPQAGAAASARSAPAAPRRDD
ncbi:MAG TPA: TCR/Tet family MFS transporter [Burkholderiaceae bacterium]|nr:TCR/Tet family MFS transporter [Burkholderiaceae bacterium]